MTERRRFSDRLKPVLVMWDDGKLPDWAPSVVNDAGEVFGKNRDGQWFRLSEPSKQGWRYPMEKADI